jgi:hypothetical protein
MMNDKFNEVEDDPKLKVKSKLLGMVTRSKMNESTTDS